MANKAGLGGASAVIVALMFIIAGPLHAAAGGYSGNADRKPIVKLIDQGQ